MAYGWIETGKVGIWVSECAVKIDVYDKSETRIDERHFTRHKPVFRFLAYGEIYGGQHQKGVYVKMGSFIEHPWRKGDLIMERKSTHGNSKLERLAEVCKGFIEIVRKTELEYSDPGVQSFLNMMARESIDLLNKETKEDIDL
jgi:hypothetical protein